MCWLFGFGTEKEISTSQWHRDSSTVIFTPNTKSNTNLSSYGQLQNQLPRLGPVKWNDCLMAERKQKYFWIIHWFRCRFRWFDDEQYKTRVPMGTPTKQIFVLKRKFKIKSQFFQSSRHQAAAQRHVRVWNHLDGGRSTIDLLISNQWNVKWTSCRAIAYFALLRSEITESSQRRFTWTLRCPSSVPARLKGKPAQSQRWWSAKARWHDRATFSVAERGNTVELLLARKEWLVAVSSSSKVALKK